MIFLEDVGAELGSVGTRYGSEAPVFGPLPS